jgi:flagellar biosynthesis protein FliQ
VEADRALNLLVSILQVATQMQEMTLSYVPKLLVAAMLLILLGPWMIARITDFARGLYLVIPTLAS